MRFALLCVAVLFVGSSCTLTRAVHLPPALPLELGPPSGASFALTDVSWKPPSSDALALHDFSGVAAAAKAHVKDVLSQSEAVGASRSMVQAPQYAVEVAIAHGENFAPNGLTLIPLTAYAGLAVGAGVAVMAFPPAGIALGLGALGSLAVGGVLPMTTYAGTLTAEVRVRRAADGVEVAQRTCTVAWKEPLSSVAWREGWARSLGAHVGELESEIGKSLRDVFMRDGPAELQAAAR